MRLLRSVSSLYSSGTCGLRDRVSVVSPIAVHHVPVRHGTKRTSKTLHYSPQDYTRDIYAKVSKSLYHNPDDWTEEPQYPEIIQPLNTPDGIRYQRRLEGAKIAAEPGVHDKIRSLTYAPDPLILKRRQRLNDRYKAFWQPWMIPGFSLKYDILPFYQHLTHTAVVGDDLPLDYYINAATLDAIVEKIRLPVIDALLMQKKFFNKNLTLIPEEEQGLLNSAQNVVEALVRAVDIVCARDYPHLTELQVDTNTRCEAMWRRSGFEKHKDMPYPDYPKYRKAARETHPSQRNTKRWKGDLGFKTACYVSGEQRVQYEESDKLFKNFRHENPLPPVVPRESSLTIGTPVNIDFYPCEEPEFSGAMETYHPGAYGFEIVEEDMHYPKWIPGFWPGDPCEFSTLSVKIPGSWQQIVEKYGEEEGLQNMKANLIIGSFGRVMAQALYLGFSYLNELTYPITTQSICTNGRDWIFGTYQANTIAVWHEDQFNPHRNLCWISKPIKLFERLEDDKVVEFNDDVLKNFLRQYLKSPSKATDVNLRPYLLRDEKSYWKTEASTVPFYQRTVFGGGVKQRPPPKMEI
ncbi:28S ribosomal protein S30, mitochondrial-like [Paramacrobiotus metropolitanus]|uniref:28S ribosomal protein S30, mitochondrial-like n=1 Tax=Paramacrobiotus metropolitanus TaxID=2943436 RepID=UPI002446593D|nr:28S ribosomal protein S30, mitochondrial-like [Paramacrobiotus metropolitanus]